MTYNFSVAKPGAAGFELTVNAQERESKIDINPDEFNDVAGYCNKSGKAVLPFEAALYPVRTHSLANFSKDLFLPTVMNHAIKVKNTVAKVFAIIGALFFDLFTAPIRLLTCIPRIIINALKEEHPLHRYLRKQGIEVEADSAEISLLQKGLGWQRKEVHFYDFPASLFYSDYIESSSHPGLLGVDFLKANPVPYRRGIS